MNWYHFPFLISPLNFRSKAWLFHCLDQAISASLLPCLQLQPTSEVEWGEMMPGFFFLKKKSNFLCSFCQDNKSCMPTLGTTLTFL